MMKTKLYMRLLLCLMMLGLSSGAYAQDANKELLEDNNKWAKELEAKEKEYNDSVGVLVKINNNVENTKEKLQNLQQKNQNANLLQQITVLKAECDSLQLELDSKQQSLSLAQADEKAKREQELADLLAQQKKDSTMLLALRSQIEGLTKFKENWLSQIVEQKNHLLAIPNDNSDLSQIAEKIKEFGEYKKFDDEKGTVATAESMLQKKLVSCATSLASQWLSIPYSEINVGDLVKAIDTLQVYQGLDASGEIAKAVARLSNIKDQYDIYQLTVKTLNSPYSSSQVSEIAGKLNNIMSQVNNQNRRAQLNTLSQQLSQYSVAVAKFQDIINNIENSPRLKVIMSNGTFLPSVAGVVKGEISKELGKRTGDIDLIKAIPWLSSQFEIFTEEVTPSNYSTVIKTIKDLK